MQQFPPTNDDQVRLDKYRENKALFFGEHSKGLADYLTQQFSRKEVRFLSIPYAGMISTVSADLLFEDFPKITTTNNNDYLEALKNKNNLEVQFYESALSASYFGDAVFRVRAEDNEVVVEDVNPEVWFPEYDPGNVKKEPISHRLMFRVELNERNNQGEFKQGVLVERHLKGQIEYTLYELKDDGTEIKEERGIELYDEALQPVVETGIEDFLVVHIKNYGVNSSRFGISDYHDLKDIMYAIDNRVSRTENILDKHGDPILAVPRGVLDDTGQVSREQMGVIEMGQDMNGSEPSKPEYIVWDAKLESSFQQLSEYIDQLLLFSQISPALLGKDKEGQAESGRALKFKMLRTLSMKHRKEKYYENGMKRIFRIAQEFAENNGYTANGVSSASAEDVVIEWNESFLQDEFQQTEMEVMKVNNGLSGEARAISRLEGISLKEARERVQENQLDQQQQQPASPSLEL